MSLMLGQWFTALMHDLTSLHISDDLVVPVLPFVQRAVLKMPSTRAREPRGAIHPKLHEPLSLAPGERDARSTHVGPGRHVCQYMRASHGATALRTERPAR